MAVRKISKRNVYRSSAIAIAALLHGTLLLEMPENEESIDTGSSSNGSLAISLSTVSFVSKAHASSHMPKDIMQHPSDLPEKSIHKHKIQDDGKEAPAKIKPQPVEKQFVDTKESEKRHFEKKTINKLPKAESTAKKQQAFKKDSVLTAERSAKPLVEKPLAKVAHSELKPQNVETVAEPSEVLDPSDGDQAQTLASAAASISQDLAGLHQQIVTKPKFKAPPSPPIYPRLARKRGQEGTVWLDIWLDELGDQTRLKVHQSSGNDQLDKAAIKAVSQWHFVPRNVDGLDIASRVRIPINFKLN